MIDIQTLPPDICFLSELYDLIFVTDEPLPAVIRVTDEDEQETILQVTLAYNKKGRMTFYDLETSLRAYMNARKVAFLHVGLYWGHDEQSWDDDFGFSVVYNSFSLWEESTEMLDRIFFSPRRSMIIPPKMPFTLHFYVPTRTALTAELRILYEDAEGTLHTQTLSKEIAVSTSVARMASYTFGYDALCPVGCRLVLVAVLAGTRRMNIFYRSLPHAHNLQFRNCFNLLDNLFLAGEVTQKMEVTQSEASVRGRALQYDRKAVKMYDFESAPIPQSQLYMVEQLFCSSEVRIDGREVIVTAHTSEICPESPNLQKVKFSYREVAPLPHLEFSMPLVDEEVFTEQFTSQFT